MFNPENTSFKQLTPVHIAILQNDRAQLAELLKSKENLLSLANEYYLPQDFYIFPEVASIVYERATELLKEFRENKITLPATQVAWLLSQYGTEEDLDKSLITIFNKIEHPIKKAKIGIFIGDYFRMRRNFGLAIEYFLKSNELLANSADKYHLTLLLFFFGKISTQQDKFDEAINYLLRAKAICPNNLPWLAIIIQSALSGVYFDKDECSNGDYVAAQKNLILAAQQASSTDTKENKVVLQTFYENTCTILLGDIFFNRAMILLESPKNDKQYNIMLAKAMANYEKSFITFTKIKFIDPNFVESFVKKYIGIIYKEKYFVIENSLANRFNALLQKLLPTFFNQTFISFTPEKFDEDKFTQDLDTLYTVKSAIYQQLQKKEIPSAKLMDYLLLSHALLVSYCQPEYQTDIENYFINLYISYFKDIYDFKDEPDKVREHLTRPISVSVKLCNADKVLLIRAIIEHIYQVVVTAAGKNIYGNVKWHESLEYEHTKLTTDGFYFAEKEALQTYLKGSFGILYLGFFSEDANLIATKKEKLNFIFTHYKAALAGGSLKPNIFTLKKNEKKINEIVSHLRNDQHFIYKWHCIFTQFLLTLLKEFSHEHMIIDEKYFTLYAILDDETFNKPEIQVEIVENMFLFGKQFFDDNDNRSITQQLLEKSYKNLKKRLRKSLLSYSTQENWKQTLESTNIEFEKILVNGLDLEIVFKSVEHLHIFNQCLNKEHKVEINSCSSLTIRYYMTIPSTFLKVIEPKIRERVAKFYRFEKAKFEKMKNVKAIADNDAAKKSSEEKSLEIITPKKQAPLTKWSFFSDSGDSAANEDESEKKELDDNFLVPNVEQEKLVVPIDKINSSFTLPQHIEPSIQVANANYFPPSLPPSWVRSLQLTANEAARLYQKNKELFADLAQDLDTIELKAKSSKANFNSIIIYFIQVAVKLKEIKFDGVQSPFVQDDKDDQNILWRNILCDCMDEFKKQKYFAAALEINQQYLKEYIQQIIYYDAKKTGYLISLKQHPLLNELNPKEKIKELAADPLKCLQSIVEQIPKIQEFVSVTDAAMSIVFIGELARILRDKQNKFCQDYFNSELKEMGYSPNILKKLTSFNKKFLPEESIWDRLTDIEIQHLLSDESTTVADLLLIFIGLRNSVCHNTKFKITDYQGSIVKIKTIISTFDNEISKIPKFKIETKNEEFSLSMTKTG